ncbi:MAG: nuclear transport factor 2 family protein [Steroidobacteraceae bacterium]
MQIARRIALATMGLIAIAASASAPTASDTAADEAALRAADQTFMRAYWKGALETVVALYAEDAVFLPANAPEVKGRDAIRKYYATDMAGLKPGEAGMILESTQGVSGNLGWSSGRAKDTAANGATTGTWKFLSVSRKVNGKWLYIRDIWNSDGPP